MALTKKVVEKSVVCCEPCFRDGNQAYFSLKRGPPSDLMPYSKNPEFTKHKYKGTSGAICSSKGDAVWEEDEAEEQNAEGEEVYRALRALATESASSQNHQQEYS